MSDGGRRQTCNNGELTEGNGLSLFDGSREVVGEDVDALRREPPFAGARLAFLYADNLSLFGRGDGYSSLSSYRGHANASLTATLVVFLGHVIALVAL